MKASDQQVESFEALSARVLGGGVAVSAACLALGLALSAFGLPSWEDRLLQAGLLVLMITPGARVLVSLVEYLRARDWFFVATTFAVILVLLAAVWSAVATR